MHEKLTEIIARETEGKSYRARSYSLDDSGRTYESHEEHEESVRVWKKSAESSQRSKYIDLYSLSQKLSHSGEQIFTYFIDGTRRVFRIDEILYGSKLYPVTAGQVCVGCCRRHGKKLYPDRIKHEIVIALPGIADYDGTPGFFPALAHKLNDSRIMKSSGLEISSVLTYKTGNDKLEDKAEACIQTRMLEREKELTEQIAKKLNYKNYLIKDGSLEYRKQPGMNFQNYRWVIGISKSFNPEICRNNQGRNDPGYIAELPLYNRTQAACFENDISGDTRFAVWYIRLHERTNRNSAFDGIIKVEKMLVTQIEREQGIMNSDEIDTLSAYILNERSPVCSVKDPRWASHIYPVYLTESYIKSKYISTEIFMHLF
jgi:hypothetical protein